MIQEFFDWDAKVFLYFNNLGNEKWDWFWLLITEKETWIPLYILFIVLLYLKLGWKKTLVAAICITLMIAGADQLTNLIKFTFKRYRPCHNEAIQGMFRSLACEGRGRFGFTSAHASNHMAIAIFVGTILRSYYKWLTAVLIFWAILIAYSRVYVGVHFTGDIFFGMWIGVAFGLGFVKFYQYLIKKYQNKLN